MSFVHRTAYHVAIVSFAVVLLGFVGLRFVRPAILPMPLDRCTTRNFDSVAWHDSSLAYSAAAIRGCMVDDLLRGHTLTGLSRAALIELLGEPRPTSVFAEYDLVYWLGPERSLMSIDSEWLLIRLDSVDRVMDFTLATD